MFNSKKENQNSKNEAREKPRSSGVLGVGIEFQGNKEGIADIPVAEKGTKVFTADGEPVIELTNAFGPSLPNGSTAITPDGEGFSNSDSTEGPVENPNSFEIIYTVVGDATSGASYGSGVTEADRGVTVRNTSTTDEKAAEKDSIRFVNKEGSLVVPGTVRIIRDTIHY